MVFPDDSAVKNPPANAGDAGDSSLIPALGRSPREENVNPSRIVAWKVPWTEEPGRLQSMGSQGVRHDWAHAHVIIIPSRWHWSAIRCHKIEVDLSWVVSVTKSKLVMPTAAQTNKPTGEFWGQVRELPSSCWTSVPKNHLAWVRIQACFMLKGVGVGVNSNIPGSGQPPEGMC